MQCRMYCVDCGVTDFAATRLDGSDTVESVGWVLGGLPGWLYCAMRHLLRSKHCAHCGSEALLRETRASRVSSCRPSPPHYGTPISTASSRVTFPEPLRDPRRRLRRGTPWLAAWLLAAFGLSGAGVLLGVSWLAFEGLRFLSWDEHDPVVARTPGGPGHWHAWDDRGRPLRVELL